MYPAGRLDYQSEGLLLLTNHGPWQHAIAEPTGHMLKRYYAQVEATPTAAGLNALCEPGVQSRGESLQAVAARLIAPPRLPERSTPVTPHRAAASSWLEVTLATGRNRQVRRMLAVIGHPVLRLLRFQIGPFRLDGLRPGEWRRVPDAARLLQRSSDGGSQRRRRR